MTPEDEGLRRPGGARSGRPGGLWKAARALLVLCAFLRPALAWSAGSAAMSLKVRVALSTSPADVVDLTAAPTGTPGSIQISWTEPGASAYAGSASSYTLRVATAAQISNDSDFNNPSLAYPLSAFSPSLPPVPGPGGSLRSQVLARLTPGVTFYFALQATNNNVPPLTDHWLRDVPSGRNASNFAVSPAAAPSVPTGLSAASNDGQVSLTWTPNPEWDLAYYRLWRATGTPSSFAPLAVTTSTAFADLGLTDGVTYYYRLSAVEIGPLALESGLAQTATGYPRVYLLPIVLNSILPGSDNKELSLQWSDPNPAPAFTMILRREGSPPSLAPAFGASYPVGTLLGGATVAYSGTGTSFTDAGLARNATWYYALYASANGRYSAATSTSAFLHEPAMPPAGVDRDAFGSAAVRTMSVGTAISTVTIHWYPVTAAADGTPFAVPPTAGELSGYRVYRSSALTAPPDEAILLPSTATSWTEATGGADHYYKISAVDGFGAESEPSLWIDAFTGDEYKLADDGSTMLRLAHAAVPAFNAQKATLSVTPHPEELGGKVLQSIAYTAYRTDNAQVLPPDFSLPDGGLQISFYYRVFGAQLSFVPQVSVPSSQDMGVFWFNGKGWFKLYGSVSSGSQSVWLNSSAFGRYQVRQLERTQDFTFDPSTLTQRFLTPNGDHKNDNIIFKVSNPAAVEVTGKIFDVRGAFVSDMPYDLATDTLLWDGKSNGVVVPGGVYIYQIQAEGKTFTGTVVVIR